MKVVRHTLSNGIRTVIVEMPDREVVATSVYVGAGGRYETPETYGISHFLEHMLLKGTKKYPSRQELGSLIESVGGRRMAQTNSEWSRFHNILPKKHYLIGFDVLSEQLSNSLLKEEEIEKEKGTIMEEINMIYSNPQRVMWSKIGGLAWEGNALENDLLGSKKNIASFNRKALMTYMKKHYVSGNMAICVAGKVDSSKIIEQLEKYFGGIKKGKRINSEKTINDQSRSRILIIQKEIDQARMVLAYKALPFLDKRKFVLNILMTILAGGVSSILPNEIRNKRGLAYDFGGSSWHYQDAGLALFFGGINKEGIFEALRIIKQEIDKSKNNLFSNEQIRRAKEYFKGRDIMRFDEAMRTSLEYAWTELFDPEKRGPKEDAKLIDKVTAEEIREVAREVFQDKNENLVVIGPYKSEEKFEKALKDY